MKKFTKCEVTMRTLPFPIIMALLVISFAAFAGEEKPKYKNPALPIEERVEDLVQRMTLEEKAGQLISFFSRDTLAFDKNGNFIGIQDTAIINRGVGALSSRAFWFRKSDRERAQCLNGIQKYMIEKTRLGTPVLFFSEALHGLMAKGATSFPQAIALGSTWDTTLVEQIFSVAALEGRARGTRQVLSPVIDLAREPRWGRTEECYSEDPYVVSRMGMAAVFGLQGRSEILLAAGCMLEKTGDYPSAAESYRAAFAYRTPRREVSSPSAPRVVNTAVSDWAPIAVDWSSPGT